MDGCAAAGMRHKFALTALLVGAALLQCHHFNAPLLDGMSMKQVYVANKARAIARPPFDLFRNTFDFLEPDGRRQVLTEEAPLYCGILGAGYRLFGEHDWLGRILSIAATVVALAALYDLLRREYNRNLALIATFLLSLCPLLLVYGRAVQADSAMLACMLLAATCHHRYLERRTARWWVAAATAGALAGLFKYYGLMVLLPLADLTRRRRCWKACFAPDFLLLALAMAAPVAAWTFGVFLTTPNPIVRSGPYFLFQMPELLCGRSGNLYKRFLRRFLMQDCGLVNLLLIVAGAWAAVFRGRRPGWMGAWTVLGIAFFFLLGPKLLHHNYYELMLFPAAAFWAAVGWTTGWEHAGGRPLWRWLGGAVLAAAAVIQSPWVDSGKYDAEVGYEVVGRRLNQLCSPGGRVVVLAWAGMAETVHYSHHEGWGMWAVTVHAEQWAKQIDRCKELGAEYAAVYWNADVTREQRESCSPLLSSLPVVEHRCGPWSVRRRPAEYYILRLKDAAPVTPQE
jgi:4-amino-4-deoxy-L-arabinose transferase-like glycosyltransferase